MELILNAMTVDLPRKKYARAQRLLGSSRFPSGEHLVTAALRQFLGRKKRRQRGARVAVPATQEPAGNGVGQALARLSLDNCREPCPMLAATPLRPEDERLFAQVNSLAGLKFLCRGVAAAVAGQDDWLPLASVTDRLVGAIGLLGTALAEADEKAGRKRDEQLATGLPRHEQTASLARFANLYVARTTKKGDVHTGALCHFGLGVLDGDQFVLTEAGLRLALLPNPVLDDGPARAEETLSPEEQDFLRQHIDQFLPGEHRDAEVIVAAVTAGHITPESLLAAVRGAFPEEWTPAVFRSHVGGVIARLVELGRLARGWQGRWVRYNLVPTLQEEPRNPVASPNEVALSLTT